MSARDALAYVDQVLSANWDNGPSVVWTNHEVIEMLSELYELLTTQPPEQESGR